MFADNLCLSPAAAYIVTMPAISEYSTGSALSFPDISAAGYRTGAGSAVLSVALYCTATSLSARLYSAANVIANNDNYPAMIFSVATAYSRLSLGQGGEGQCQTLQLTGAGLQHLYHAHIGHVQLYRGRGYLIWQQQQISASWQWYNRLLVLISLASATVLLVTWHKHWTVHLSHTNGFYFTRALERKTECRR